MKRNFRFKEMTKAYPTKAVKLAILLILGALTYQIAAAQTSSMGSRGIVGKLVTVIDQAEERGLEVVRIEADVIRTTKETVRTLDPSFTHTIAAVAGERIKDIGIEIYREVNNEWILVEQEDDMTAAVVAISPTSMTEYKIVVRARQFAPGFNAGHFGLIFIIENKK
jgi:hypothetical protein